MAQMNNLYFHLKKYEKGSMFWLSAHCFKQKPENKKEKKKRMRVGVCENFVRMWAARGTCFVWHRESQGLGLRLRSQLLLTPLRDIIS